MKARDVHELLKDDAAYMWSIENDDIINMQLVLRAYGLAHTPMHAETMLVFCLSGNCKD